MQESHGGVTIENPGFYDNPSAALQLGRRSHVPKLRAGEMPENLIAPIDEKGRPRVVLPDPSNDCDPELYGKSPQESAEVLARRDREADEHADTDRIMREFPGKSSDAPRSSNSGKSPKSKPAPEAGFHTKRCIRDAEAPAEFRPHTVSGKVSTKARHGLLSAGASIGVMLDVLGETLQSGVSWRDIQSALNEMSGKYERVA